MSKRFNWKMPETLGVISAFLSGLMVHMFGLINVLHNHDDIAAQPFAYGAGIESGRWFLDDLGKLMQFCFGGYDLYWVNGLIFIGFIALSIGFIISVFNVKSKNSAILIGLIFISFPSVTGVMFFRFTAGYYGLAILLAVLSAWFLVKIKWGIIPSILCSALSLGIYQAYLPLTIAILVLVLIQQSLFGEAKIMHIIIRGLYFCTGLLFGFLLYWGILHWRLSQNNLLLTEYQSIDTMGQIKLTELPVILFNAFKAFCLMPIRSYIYGPISHSYNSLAQTGILQLSYIAIGLLTAAIGLVTIAGKRPNIGQLLVFFALCLVFPLAVNFIAVMCPNSVIHTLMLYAFATVPCTPLILMECMPNLPIIKIKFNIFLKTATTIVVLLIVISNAYLANANYTRLYYANRQSENYFTSLVTQIRMTEGYTKEHKIAIIGTQGAELNDTTWQNTPSYSGNFNSSKLVRSYSFSKWWSNYCGYTYVSATDEECEYLKAMESVQNMPCWPDEGSIRVVGEFVVLKFEEIS